MKSIDRTGEKFGLLTVLGSVKKGKHIYYRCVCDCGSNIIKEIRANHLTSGRIKSCGCLYKKRKSTVLANRFEFMEDYKIGYTDDGRSFIYDLNDAEKIEMYKWYFDSDGYVIATINNKACKLHRYVYGKDSKTVDHINSHRWDNRKSNLRKATPTQNAANSKIRTSNNSGIIGVGWMERNRKWRARISYKSKEIHLGLFDYLDDAIKARLLAEQKYFQEFAPQKHLYEKYGIRDGE